MKYELSQGWTDKPLENLSVACLFEKHDTFLSARFEILEPSLKAVISGYNVPVCKDSCVELFLSFDRKNYYNFEINCIGAILGQHGMGRFDRMFLDEKILKKIRVKSSLGNKPLGIIPDSYRYTVEIEIPSEVFIFDSGVLPGTIVGNIYKCADESPSPHYMYLYKVETEKPDFHRPEFFRELL